MRNTTIESVIEASAHPLAGVKADHDSLLELVGNAHLVLLGEASHGSHEFYRARAEITRRLITEKGFSAAAVEADWPDAYRINRYVRADSDDSEALDALGDFKRFPAWMWRNADVLDFVGWLRDYNDTLSSDGTVTAASDRGGIAERKRVRSALAGSYEELFHRLQPQSFMLKLRDGGEAASILCTPRLQRAIGVVYHPQTERISHYFNARLGHQFDAVIHFDHTRAVEPLERTAHWERGELPETFPSGI